MKRRGKWVILTLKKKKKKADDIGDCSKEGASAGAGASDDGLHIHQDQKNENCDTFYDNLQKLRDKRKKTPPYYNLLRTFSSQKELLTMQGMISYFMFSNNLFHMTDDEVGRIIEYSIQCEQSALSENSINRRMWTRDYVVPPITLLDSSDPSASMTQVPETCNICLEDFKNQDKVAMLYYCQHEYHADCIKKWLLKKNLCPICGRMAFLPEHFPDWEGDDIRHHQNAYMQMWKRK